MEYTAASYAYLRSAQGLRLRYGRWSCSADAGAGAVLILQGRSEFMEKYAETITALLSRGLDVFSFDWCGQGLSDRILADPQKGFVQHYDDYLEDLSLVLETVVRPYLRGPLFFLAHSMGAHIGLRFLHRHRDVFARAVCVAPMIDLQTGLIPPFFARWLCRRQVARGCAHRPVFGAARSAAFPTVFKGNRLTSDRERFYRNRKMVMACPGLSAAVVTYGWLAATYDSIAILKKPGFAPALQTPLLFVFAGRERIVSTSAARQFAGAVAHSRTVTVADARHEILQEQDRLRALFWRVFDEFISG